MKLKKPKFQLKTVWEYRTNPGEEYSRVQILYGYFLKSLGEVEVNENIYYVFIEHKILSAPYAGGLAVAVTESSLENSLTRMDESRVVTNDFIDGYEEWRAFSRDEWVHPYSEQLKEIINSSLK
ncbi:hypothetical protein ACJJI5_14135 [Microbulbifer sp. EKSA008]|uniref:hypothetical protein n=1 Tax=unclassified Microbulbifer TaxID=2619833 RepID=UPI00403B0C1D